MRNVQLLMFSPSCKIFFAATLICLQSILLWTTVTAEDLVKTGNEDLQQDEGDMHKRDWNQKLQMWGKRGWKNLHGGWGLKRSVPATWSDIPIVEKRGWDSLQGGWGKRFAPFADDATVQELAAYLGQDNDHNPSDNMNLYDVHEEDKRNWAKFNGGWGKRGSNWNNFRGSWGKRDPAWSNLKGYWGKRSDQEQN